MPEKLFKLLTNNAISFPDMTLNFEHVKPQFSTGLSNSYRCLKLQSFNLTQAGKNETVGLVKVDDVQFQAFKSDKKEAFGLGTYIKYLIYFYRSVT